MKTRKELLVLEDFIFQMNCRGSSLLQKGKLHNMYLTKNTKTHKYYAIKVYILSRMDDNQRAKLKTQQQLVLSKLKHKNVAKLVAVFSRGEEVYFVFDHRQQRFLSDLIRENALNKRAQQNIFYQLFKIVSFLHRKRVTSFSLEPEDIWVD